VLGLSDETLGLTGFDPVGTFLISGPPLSGRSNALAWIATSLTAIREERVLAYLGNSRSELSRSPLFARAATNPDDVAVLAREIAGEIVTGAASRYAVIVEGIAEFLQTSADQAIVELARQVKRHGHFLAAENEVAGWAGSWPLFAEVKNGRRGLLLQPDSAEGELLLRTPLPRAMRSDLLPGRGAYVERGRATRVQIPHLVPIS